MSEDSTSEMEKQRDNPTSRRLEGMAAVKGGIQGGFRSIHEIALDRKREDRGTTWLVSQARRNGIPVRRTDRDELDVMAEGGSHGGIIASIGDRTYQSLQELLPDNPSPSPFIVMIDGIEDPYNLGFAIRTLWAAGADGLVLRGREWRGAEAVIARSSAGASELMPTALVPDPDEAADFYREAGLAIAVTAKETESRSLYETDLTTPLFVLIGGEKRGVKRSFLAAADLLLHIPYARDFRQSLGAASAAAIIGFEVMRQRGRE